MAFTLSPARRPAQRPLAPADRFIAAHAAVLVVFASWAGGGGFAWARTTILVLAALGLPAIALRRREGGKVRLAAFACLALWLSLLGIALLNPSHQPTPGGGWAPRPGWISWLPTTVDREASVAAQVPWLAALLEASLLVAVRPHRRAVRFIWSVVALNGFALAAVGAAFRFDQAGAALGFIAVPEPSYFFATFFYKNHWAAYGALCAATGISLALRAWDQAEAGEPTARGRALLFSSTALLTAITLPLPGSRLGAALAVFLVGLWLWGMASRARGRRRGLKTVLLVAGGLAIAGYGYDAYRPQAEIDVQRTLRQLASARTDVAPDIRFLASRDTARMALARPWFGWGVGSFPLVFPVFQGDYLRGPDGRPAARFEFAHDDWLQMAAEAGVVGLAILLVPVVRLVRAGWRAGGPARVVVGGCAAVAAIAWVDFPFNNAAVISLWSLLLASAPRSARVAASGSEAPAEGTDRAYL